MPRTAPPRKTHAARAEQKASWAPDRLPINRGVAERSLAPAGTGDEGAGLLAAIGQLAARASAPAPLVSADAGWALRRLDDKGRVPVRELVQLNGLGATFQFQVCRTPSGTAAITVIPCPAGGPASASLHGDRLTIPLAVRSQAGIPAPGDVVLVPMADATWLLMPAAALLPALQALAPTATHPATGSDAGPCTVPSDSTIPTDGALATVSDLDNHRDRRTP